MNCPDRCSIESSNFAADSSPRNWETPEIEWQTLLPKQKLKADQRHFFELEIKSFGAVTYLRLNIFHDGGLNRFRVLGVKAD